MAATATSQSNPETALRAGRLSSMRDRMGRTGRGALLGLSMLGATPSFQREDVPSFEQNLTAQMRANRHTVQRYANPGATTPMLQETSLSLRDGNTDQDEDANEIDELAAEIADENDSAQTMQLAARARSRAKGISNDAAEKVMEQAMKKGQELMEEIKAEIISKAGMADDGELLLTANTGLTGMSVLRSIMGILSEVFEKYNVILSKASLPVPKHLKWVGGAGTVMEVLLYMSIIFIILFLITFTVLAYGTVGSILHGNITNAYTLLKGAL